MDTEIERDRGEPSTHWLRAIWGMSATSFLGDLGYEAQNTLLPSFMAALGLSPLALGLVEGLADATANFVKLGAGMYSDRIARRKPIVVAGYLATGLASFVISLAHGLPLVLAGKLFGWFGRGIRGPLRDAMLSDVIPKRVVGRAFGFHRFSDTLGAVLGPLAATVLLASLGTDRLRAMRTAMTWTLVPGVLSALVFALCVVERSRKPGAPRAFGLVFRELPRPLRGYLAAVFVFGAGDYAHTLLILAATQLLTPSLGALRAAAAGGGLYVLHNIVYAGVAYLAGALGDRFGHRSILGWGYAISVAAPLALIVAFNAGTSSIAVLAAVFTLAGCVNGVQDTLEAAVTASLTRETERGVSFGLLGAVNGVGDLISSAFVGLLWAAHPALGFGYAALCMALGALLMLLGSRRSEPAA